MTGYNFVGDRRRGEAEPRASASVAGRRRCGPGQMTTESGRQRDAAVARRKLNRDYRLVSWAAIIRRAPSVGSVPLGTVAGPASCVARPRNDITMTAAPMTNEPASPAPASALCTEFHSTDMLLSH